MKLPKKIVISLFVLLAGVVTAHSADALRVLSASPKGQQTAVGRQAVNVHFNQPVVKLDEKSAFSSEDCPLEVSPKINGSCRFSGSQTLIFEPAENWPVATRFTIKIPKGFRSQVSGQKLAAAYTFSFDTPTPQVVTVLPYKNEHWVSLNPTLYVLTNLPVDISRAASFATLQTMQDKKTVSVAVKVRTLTQEEVKKNFSYLSTQEQESLLALTPVQTLRPGQKYTLVLAAGLPASAGNLGMAQKYETSFYTYPSLTVQKIISTGCLPFTPALHLSTPVRKQALYDALQIVPASAKLPLQQREGESVGYEFTNSKTGEAYFNMPLSFIDVKPYEKVEVTIQKGLQDIYGNTLEQDQHFTITNDGYCPAVNFSADGIGVLESYLPLRLPISLMNIPSLWMESARFNRENFIPFQETQTSYCAKKPLTGPTYAADYTFKEVKDKTLRTYIDLARFQPTVKDSIIFSQFKTKQANEGRECWVSATDNITDVGVTFKTSAQDLLIWTTSLKTGAPVGGLQVELRSKDNKVVWTGTTDEHGLAMAPGWGKLEVPATDWGQPALYAFVTSKGGDAVISNRWNDGVEPWRFNINYDYNPTAQTSKTFLFAERGLYRPGETVHLKGVIRQQQNGQWQLPQIVRGNLIIQDGRGEEFAKQEVTISSKWGSFDYTFELPESAVTGYWDVQFVPHNKLKEESSASTSFQVESVKPADFNVFVKASMPEFLAGEEATFSTSAQYYFGAPLPMAKARWNLRQEATWFTPKGYEEYTFIPYFLQHSDDQENGKEILSSSGQLDSRGGLMFAAKMPRAQVPLRVYAEVEIESPAHQNLFKRTSVLVHPADIYVGAKPVKDTYEQGRPAQIHVVAVTPEGKPAETTVQAEIYREEYYSVRKVGLAGRLEWVSEKKITPLPSQTLKLGKKGTTLEFIPQEAGSYLVKFTAKDLFGRKVQGGVEIYVHGKDDFYVQRTQDDILQLTPDKNEYKMGQTARIRVHSPYQNAYALVSAEREGILDAWTEELTEGENILRIPIKETYLPNVYVSVMLVQGRSAKPADYKEDLGKPQGKIGYVNLNVIPDGKRIETTVKTNAKKYEPGQKVTVSLATKVRGKGVPAEVTVMVVDEGILALTNYQMPDLFDSFYGSAPLSVFTADNRAYVIGQRNFGEKGENRGGGGSVSSKLGGTDLRSRFLFTPYYAASVHTDEKGRADVSFELPDNLTTFRIMAVAATASEFGKAQQTITVEKPVIAMPKLPRFVRENDRFTCGIILHNYEDNKGKFTVQALAMGNVTLENPTAQLVTVPKGQSKEVNWQCQAGKPGDASLAFVAKGRYTDGVQTEWVVASLEKAQTLALYGATQNTQQEIAGQPENVDAWADNRAEVSISSTALLQLKGALSYLLTYPYNCLEQQLSKIRPAVSAEELVKDFKLADVEKLHQTAQEVLNRLGNYQHASGGFGYWPDALPDAYLTTYALDVALQAKQAGFDVPAAVVDKAIAWLENAFSQESQREYAYSFAEESVTRAYSTYVLARYGKNTDGMFNTLYAKRAQLPLPAVSYLLQAAHAAKRARSIEQILAQQILNKMVYTPTMAYLDMEDSLPWIHINQTTQNAQALKALLVTDLSPDTDFQMVAWLLSRLNDQGNWNDTYANAEVLAALQAYYQAREAAVPNFTASVKQDGQERLSAAFEGRNIESKTWSVPFTALYKPSNRARFTFEKQGAGTLYYTLTQHYTPASYHTPADAGFSVTRTLSTLDGSPVNQILTGERYKVTLHIKTASSRSFVVAEDFIPAGFSLVNTTLATESATQAQLLAKDNTRFTHTEQYEDRVYGFANELPAGEHTFSYLVSATCSGTFTYPAAWVSQMYAPEVFGRNATSTLVIE